MGLAQRTAARPNEAVGPEPAPRFIENSVLIAEDDASIREVLRSLLVNAGYLVFVAANGREALAFCGHLAASLTLLDLIMPHGNGLVTCEAIRKLPGWSQVPVVMLTGACTDDIVRAALRVGATGFVAKPFVPEDLLARIGVWTGRVAPQRRADPRVWRRELALEQFPAAPEMNVLAWTTTPPEPAVPDHARHDDARAILRAMHAGKSP